MPDSISIEYCYHSGSDLEVANAARVSFDKRKDELDDKDVKLINYLAKHEHTSPFRHNSITLRCTAPIFLARQLGKHQVGLSWNEVSRRYVDSEPEFYYPDKWRKRPSGSVKQGSGDEIIGEPIDAWYRQFMVDSENFYSELLDFGVAPEMARMVLPQSMLTSWIWTGSLMAFYHVWRLRIDSHAQKEAQIFGQKLEEVVKPLFPHSWEALRDS